MTLQWFDEDPIEIDENLELPQFDLKGYYKHKCAMAYKTGKGFVQAKCLNVQIPKGSDSRNLKYI